MRVLSLVTHCSSTSIPVELAWNIQKSTEIEVEIASFYDNSREDTDPDVRELDIKIHPLGATSRFDLQSYKVLRKLMDGFDVLHTHHNFLGSLGRLVAQGSGVQIVNTEHNDHRHFTHLQNIVNCPTYPLADAVVANSKSTQNSFRRYEQPFLKLTNQKVIYNGVDLERISRGMKRADIPALPDGKLIVTAASLTRQKNISSLIEAMPIVLDSLPEAELVIVGDGPLREELENQTYQSRVNPSTTFLGYLPEREQVYGTMAKCDVFAVPSHYEGFCNAAVEAMGVGLPVVASDIDVLREVVGEGGVFVDPTDPANIATHLIELFENEEYRLELAELAIQRSRDKFAIEKTVEQYRRLYFELF